GSATVPNLIANPGIFYVVHNQSFDPGAQPPVAMTRIADIGDGTSNTVMMSEGLNAGGRDGGVMGDVQLSVMGGSLVSTFHPPNGTNVGGPTTAQYDRVQVCPYAAGDLNYRAGPGAPGQNQAMCIAVTGDDN